MENSYMKQICYLRLKNDYSEKNLVIRFICR